MYTWSVKDLNSDDILGENEYNAMLQAKYPAFSKLDGAFFESLLNHLKMKNAFFLKILYTTTNLTEEYG